MRLVEELIVGLFREFRGLVWEIFERELLRVKWFFKCFIFEEVIEEFGSEEKVSREMGEFFWIIDILREFYDREVDGVWRNYDFYFLEGYGEVFSGGEREWEYEKI